MHVLSYRLLDQVLIPISVSDEFGPPRTPTGYHPARNGHRQAIQPPHNAIGPHRRHNNMDGHEAIEMNSWSPRTRIPPSQLDSMEGFFLEVWMKHPAITCIIIKLTASLSDMPKGGYIERRSGCYQQKCGSNSTTTQCDFNSFQRPTCQWHVKRLGTIEARDTKTEHGYEKQAKR